MCLGWRVLSLKPFKTTGSLLVCDFWELSNLHVFVTSCLKRPYDVKIKWVRFEQPLVTPSKPENESMPDVTEKTSKLACPQTQICLSQRTLQSMASVITLDNKSCWVPVGLTTAGNTHSSVKKKERQKRNTNLLLLFRHVCRRGSTRLIHVLRCRAFETPKTGRSGLRFCSV